MSIDFLLFKKSNKNSLGRFFVMITAITLGVAIVLSYVAGMDALFQTAYRSRVSGSIEQPTRTLDRDIRGGDLVVKQIAKTGETLSIWRNHSIIVDQIARFDGGRNFAGMIIPKPGEFIASPALAKAMKSDPSLRERLAGGKFVGTVPDKFLASPDELVLYSGLDKADINNFDSDSLKVVSISDIPSEAQFGAKVSTPKIIMVVIGSVTLLIPIMLLVANASELGLAQRERRYAILRLVGATKRQVNSSIIFESVIASCAGIILGSLLYVILRPIYQWTIEFDGHHLFMNDISIQFSVYLLVVFISIALSVLVDLFSLRTIKSSPLGVVKSAKVHRSPRLLSVIPLAIGIALLIGLNFISRSWASNVSNGNAMLLLVFVIFSLLMVGMLISGSYITMLVGRIIGHLSKRPVVILATKRIAFMPKRTFRTVGGVVLALFAGCFYLSSVSAIQNYISHDNPDVFHRINDQTAIVSFNGSPWLDQSSDGGPSEDIGEKIDSEAIDNATHAISILAGVTNVQKVGFNGGDFVLPTDKIGHYFNRSGNLKSRGSFTALKYSDAGSIKPASTMPSTDYSILIFNFASPKTLELVRNAIVKYTGGIADNPAIIIDQGFLRSQTYSVSSLNELTQLAYIAIAITILVSMLNIFISTVGGILERKSSFYNLWLCGVNSDKLRVSLLIESIAPLVVFSAIASVLGYFVAKSMIYHISPVNLVVDVPWVYYLIVVGLLCLAVAGIWAISRSVRRLVNANSNQTE